MKQINRFTWTALLVALVLLLGLTPLGLIPLGFIYVTILCLPVIIGTLLLGLPVGMLLGLTFGAVSAFRLFTAPSTLAGNLLGASPLLALLMTIVPRLLIPVVAHLVYHRMKDGRAAKVAAPVASALGSLTNTALYLGMMLLFYGVAGLDSAAVQSLIIGTGLIAGTSEAVVAALIVPPVLYALRKVMQKK